MSAASDSESETEVSRANVFPFPAASIYSPTGTARCCSKRQRIESPDASTRRTQFQTPPARSDRSERGAEQSGAAAASDPGNRDTVTHAMARLRQLGFLAIAGLAAKKTAKAHMRKQPPPAAAAKQGCGAAAACAASTPALKLSAG
ncbi:hypothetical protein ACP70R_023346 [Stipagrostis hirtigluma subsp. patula]